MTVSSRDDTLTFPQRFARGWIRNQGTPEWCANPDTEPGPCAICGGHEPEGRWQWQPTDNFSDCDKLRRPDQSAICLGCRLLSRGGPSRSERGNWRKWTLYTLATNGGESRVLLKDRKPEIRRLILDGWAVAINDTGKKHVGFWGPDDRSAYLPVTFDRERLLCTLQEFQSALDLTDTLYRAGMSKASLESASPTAAERHRVAQTLGYQPAWQLFTKLTQTPPAVRRAAAWLAEKEEAEQ